MTFWPMQFNQTWNDDRIYSSCLCTLLPTLHKMNFLATIFSFCHSNAILVSYTSLTESQENCGQYSSIKRNDGIPNELDHLKVRNFLKHSKAILVSNKSTHAINRMTRKSCGPYNSTKTNDRIASYTIIVASRRDFLSLRFSCATQRLFQSHPSECFSRVRHNRIIRNF